jgi:murein DD-endopeptidase MepM/ murein hydrolase activator NlpD
MRWARHPRTRFLLAFLGIVVAVATLVARLTRISKGRRPNITALARSSPSPSPSTLQQSSLQSISPIKPLAAASPTSSPTPGAALNESPTSDTSGPVNLIVPVAGVRPDQLRDTFSDARSEGRVHDAIDIPAAQGTAVLAAADGTIAKLFHSDRGGTTVYQLSTDGKFFYYYAHLDRYAEGLAEGQFVKQGATIGYVGDTGNAGAGNYHLHFSIARAADPKRYWEGVNINPYPLLRR